MTRPGGTAKRWGTRVLVALGLGAASLGGCDGGPRAGDIVFELTTPNQDDGAVQFLITSIAPATMAAVTAECDGCRVFTELVSETEVRGVLLGAVVPGPALRVTVSDRKVPEVYTASVTAVSDRAYRIRSSTGYGLAPRD